MQLKKSIRDEWHRKLAASHPGPHLGRAAEKLRGSASYRNAATVFAVPHEMLIQARINCLADGKNLIMPGPGIRDGFFLLGSRTVPFRDLSLAVTYKGLEKYGQPLTDSSLAKYPLDLLLVDSLAVDSRGGRIGDGDGLVDLGCALLHELGCFTPETIILTIIPEERLSAEPLPQERWDVQVDEAITPDRILQFGPRSRNPRILWDVLAKDRIRRIGPLWRLYERQAESRLRTE